jgi:hypothetical protein
MNMEDAAGEDDDDNDGKRPARKKKKSLKDAVCKHCGRKGHTTTRSKQCLHHNGRPTASNIPVAAALQDPTAADERLGSEDEAADIDQYETVNIRDYINSDDDSFRDCNTWSSADEDSDLEVLNII